jgi:hypothetical protein
MHLVPCSCKKWRPAPGKVHGAQHVVDKGHHHLLTFRTPQAQGMRTQLPYRRLSISCSASSDAARGTLLCTSIAADSVAAAVDTISEANNSGADLLELRLDFYQDFDASQHLKQLLNACNLPTIVTFRPKWEGYDAPSLLTWLNGMAC